jgi:hypothetical protein
MTTTFADLEEKDAIGRKEVDALGAVHDIAPSGSLFTSNANPLTISKREFPSLKNSELVLFYVGVISYTDAFRKHRYETKFCYFYFGNDPKIWHICDSNNTIE